MQLHEEFLKDLKWSIEETEKKNIYTPTKTYKPSSMNCIRNMYYQMTGAEAEPSTSDYCLINICNSGTDIHVRIQQEIIDMLTNGIDCQYIDVEEYIKNNNLTDLVVLKKTGPETKLHNTRYNMNFACDGILIYKGHYLILEIKTETSRKWMSRFSVDPSHYNQATAYSLSFGIDDVLFLYVNRDFLDLKTYTFSVTDIMRNELVDKINSCDNYVNINQVPPKPEIDSKHCRYCSYKNRCKTDT